MSNYEFKVGDRVDFNGAKGKVIPNLGSNYDIDDIVVQFNEAGVSNPYVLGFNKYGKSVPFQTKPCLRLRKFKKKVKREPIRMSVNFFGGNRYSTSIIGDIPNRNYTCEFVEVIPDAMKGKER